MKISPFIAAAVAIAAMSAADAQAQMFGNRSLGGSSLTKRSATPRTPRTTPGSSSGSAVGEVTGAERFIRGNRDQKDFVGVASGEDRQFIGAQGVATGSESRISEPAVKVETVTNANQALKADASRTSPRGLYSPRLTIGFQHPPLRSDEVSSNLTEQLSASLASRLEAMFAKNRIPSIEVSLEDGKATLRGTVASEHARTLAGLLALFEPGISKVENQLVVQSPGAANTAQPEAPAEGSEEQPASDTEPALKPATP